MNYKHKIMNMFVSLILVFPVFYFFILPNLISSNSELTYYYKLLRNF